jgi:hypothetical protein
MFELFKNEIWRLKIWIFISALIYLLLNSASIYFGEYADSGLMIGNVHSVIFAISSLLLGLVQFHTYKKPNRWIYLINRPASPHSICLTLLATGSVIVLFQFVIPDLLLTITMDNFSSFLIEKRHYYQAFYVFLISIAFYLSGVYIQLSHSKGAFLVIFLPTMAIISLLINGPTIMISLIVMVWLLLLVLSVFKANTHNNKTSLLGKFLAITSYQIGLYFIIVMALAFTFQLRLMILDGAGTKISWNEYYANDVYKHVEYLEGNEQMALNLMEADISTQDKYSEQMKNIKTTMSVANLDLFYTSWLLPYQQKINKLKIVDPVNDLEWTFSLDQMLYMNTGKNQANQNNTLSLNGSDGENTKFKTIPNVTTNKFGSQVITPKEIYSYNEDFQQLNLRFQLNENESFISGFNKSGSLMNILTTANIYFFDSDTAKNSNKILTPLTVVKIPGAHENLTYVEVAVLMDRTLIGFLFGKLSAKGHYSAEQIMLEIYPSSHKINTLATRPLKNGMSEMYHMMNWYISPLTHWVTEYLIKPQLRSEVIKPISIKPHLKLSTNLKAVILIIMLFSVLMALWLLKKRDLTTLEKIVWIVLISLTSLTGLMTFILLTDKTIYLNREMHND